ncbi:C39 family peptidase [Bacillus sp. EB600]|uniref:C39 family peptidase n=1 Tax=Bacillus sp. EB600 TaxID=2806345 RepID=UPI00210AD122|nr:C39 family peptidase [Bacillus sp. EB600]MCQ6278655.1 C39 family peptidase [Bacillus sp. EB600]
MGLTVERIAGINRYETAVRIAEGVGSDKAILANGENFPDALSISPYTATKGIPILLTRQVTQPVLDLLHQKSQVILVGGNQAINKSIDSTLNNPVRFEGADRYETSATIINNLIGPKAIGYIATGENFADALTGSVLAAKQQAPIILTRKDVIPAPTISLFPRFGEKKILGGLALVEYKVEDVITPLQASVHLNAPLVSQLPELPRGCEVTSLSMLLGYAGISVSKMQLASEVVKVPWESGGYKGHPNDGFVGNMYTFSQPGCCVFHSPIVSLANKYLPGRIIDLTGEDFEAIQYYLNRGKPVWVINTSWFKPVPASYWSTWKTRYGDIRITMKEHSVLITGYDNQNIYFNDPLANIKDRGFSQGDFIAGWQQYGSQAVTYQ